MTKTYEVTWDTGDPNKKHGTFCTTDYEKAKEKAFELLDLGKENVEIWIATIPVL